MKFGGPSWKRKAIFVLAAVFCGLIFVPTSTYSRFIVSGLLQFVDKEQLIVQVTKPSLSFSGIRGETSLVRPTKLPWAIIVSEPKVRILLSSLIIGKIVLEGTGKVFDGELLIRYQPISQKISVQFQNLNLAQFPPVAGFGFSKLVTSGNIEEFSFADAAPPLPTIRLFDITVGPIEKPSASQIPKRLIQLPMPITIPELKGKGITIRGRTPDGQELIIESISGSLNLGEFEGLGGLSYRTGAPTIDLTAKGKLSNIGFQEIGTPLKLFSNNRVTKANEWFRLSVEGPMSAPPKISIVPITKPEGTFKQVEGKE
ncbi:MAG: hypothetical protein KDD60_00720 [Bdellovibrionales bacterium]|nr:hypothetical protein [Bdellovibrionales bacterium]